MSQPGGSRPADAGSETCTCGAAKPQDRPLCRDCWLRKELGACDAVIHGGHGRLARPYHRARKPSAERKVG